MNVSEITNAVEGVAAVSALTYLGTNGVTDPFLIAAIAGVAGYRMKKKQNS